MKGGIEACYASVSCACALLAALDELSQGRGLQPEQARFLLRRLDDLKDGSESTRESMEINEADFRWQRHILSSEQPQWDPSSSSSNLATAGTTDRSPDISISITTETGQTTLDLEMGGLGQGHTTYVECGEDARTSTCSFGTPERTQREPIGGTAQSEKDSGRSDVSDIGSDNVSLVDEEQQTPRDCPGHRSLRTAALSLKLLRNQEADQQSARLFIQSLAALLPRLMGLATAKEVDLSLQNFCSTLCSGLQAGGIHSPGFEASDSLSCQSVMNADGLYLVSYYALLLNLKLCCCDYYRRKELPPVLSLKEFIRLIQSSGVLVVLSQAWIEELHHQVLKRNLLADAGYWGGPEDHTLPLITMLTGVFQVSFPQQTLAKVLLEANV
ncbi:hypothetical protein XENOCAPTIV_017676 [Xenoophorus captivus]|uniref:SEC7 domain-containing protein n=1 Tax=Xenoophorus captivus TaxID=1517983 RepID=A0ABV0RJ84_9TELE